jgi:hypothetical protein
LLVGVDDDVPGALVPLGQQGLPDSRAELPYARPTSTTTRACSATSMSLRMSQSSSGTEIRSKSPSARRRSGPVPARLRRAFCTALRSSSSAGTTYSIAKRPATRQ